MSNVLAVVLALACSGFWAIANVYVQRAGRAVGSLRAMFWAQSAASLGLVLLAVGLEPAPTWPGWVDLGVTAAGSAVGYYAMLTAFSSGTLSGVVPIVTAWSVPATAAGVLWSGDAPSPGQWVGGAMILVGAVGNGVLAERGETSTPRSALAWSALGAVGFGVMAAGTARLRAHVGPVGVVPAIWLVQWGLLAPVMLAKGAGTLRPPARSDWPVVLGMGLFEAAGFVAFTFASRLATMAVVSPPASLSALMTVLYAQAVLGERLGGLRWALIALASLGTLLVAVT